MLRLASARGSSGTDYHRPRSSRIDPAPCAGSHLDPAVHFIERLGQVLLHLLLFWVKRGPLLLAHYVPFGFAEPGEESRLILHLPLSLGRRPCDFAGVLDEKRGDRAKRTILQGDDSIWNAGHRQFNGQNLQLRALRRKS